MKTLRLDEFLRSLKQNIDKPNSMLLGAGASIESGIGSAADCIWQWKRDIFQTNNPSTIGLCDNLKIDSSKRIIQNWINAQNVYPEENSDEEYSFFAEKAYPIEEDRRAFFRHLIANHEPSIGYHLIAMLAQKNIIKSVWTTNFDGLMTKCAHSYSSLIPIEITAETSDRIFTDDVLSELRCIELHGDYKYGPLKNTAKELDSQNEVLRQALLHELTNRNLIVIGYSGRDKSLMEALSQVYSEKGAGRLYWCGYGADAPKPVKDLIELAENNGRMAYYISTGGFDSTMIDVATYCMSEDKEFLLNIDNLKKKLAITPNLTPANFNIPSANINKIADLNIIPFSFPKQCYQFEVTKPANQTMWEFCRDLTRYNIMAVPYENIIYAWGEKESIEEACADKLKSNIELSPLTIEVIKSNSNLQELTLKTLTCILGEKNKLGYNKNKIWNTGDEVSFIIGGKRVSAYKGVELSLFFEDKYTYFTIKPSYMCSNKTLLSKEENKILANKISDQINAGKPNFNSHIYLNKWKEKLLGRRSFLIPYPINGSNIFKFNIRCETAVLGICNQYGSSASLPPEFNPNRIRFKGLEYKDPELIFCNALTKKKEKHFHPMKGLISYGPIDYAMNQKLSAYPISIGVICPEGYERKFHEFINGLNQQSIAKQNTDYLISFPGFYNAFKVGIDLPNPNSINWAKVTAINGYDKNESIKMFGESISQKVDQLSSANVDVVLIYIPEDYEHYTSYSDKYFKYDLHNFIKAFAAQKQISTQFIREKTIDSDLTCQIRWALSLALYVKSGRIPWNIANIQKDTAFAGIGYSVSQNDSGSEIVVGCSHIYSSDGQGLKYKLSRINDITFDRKKNPYLSENEAYKLGVSIKDLFYKSFSEIPKRVVIHKRTPFRKEEIKGLTESLSSAGIKDIDLVEITYDDNLKCFALDQNNKNANFFPVRRGLAFPISDNALYLYTHGIAPSVQNPKRSYFQGGKSVPIPIKIVKHYGNGDMTRIVTEILGLSKMNWNSFELYSKLPCTIESSNSIAKIGWLLSQFDGTLYDYRYFM